MNPKERNNILTAALEHDDKEDGTYILPGSQPTYRVAYDEQDWNEGKRVRLGSIEWTHLGEFTSISCKPTLVPGDTWEIENCDCELTFRKSCDIIIDEITDLLTSQGL